MGVQACCEVKGQRSTSPRTIPRS